MVAIPIRGPALKHSLEPASLNVRKGDFLRHIGNTASCKYGIEHMEDIVEDKLAVNAHLDLATFLLELPHIKRARGWEAVIDTVMLREVLRLFWDRMCREIRF